MPFSRKTKERKIRGRSSLQKSYRKKGNFFKTNPRGPGEAS